ncbi:MAG TPA: sensor domain-containing diguanylate cyclase [Longimicrobiaceae bacterium]|nr:sensor domain-containing diguanylate cyclase [Longimicrobiaceae bacterium]
MPDRLPHEALLQLLDHLPGVAYVAESPLPGPILYVSPQLESLLGFAPGEWIENPHDWFNQIHPDDAGRVLNEQSRLSTMGAALISEYRISAKDGRTLWIQHDAHLADLPGYPAPVVIGMLTDLTHRKRAEELLRTLAYEDELTGAYNRRGFLHMAEHQLNLSLRNRRGAVLIYADVDLLKTINDELGHEAGDATLQEAAALLRTCFRSTDLIGRLGGDEFAVLAIETDENRSELLTDRLQAILEEQRATSAAPYPLSLSVGTAYFDPDQPMALQDLLAEADERMYARKQSSRG